MSDQPSASNGPQIVVGDVVSTRYLESSNGHKQTRLDFRGLDAGTYKLVKVDDDPSYDPESSPGLITDAGTLSKASQAIVDAVFEDDLELRLEIECRGAPDTRYRIRPSGRGIALIEEMAPAGAERWHANGALDVIDVSLEVEE